jgi:tRNA threonylcarbamoyladenosine biosynthesis protein TsaB
MGDGEDIADRQGRGEKGEGRSLFPSAFSLFPLSGEYNIHVYWFCGCDMLILALDTTTRAGSIAVLRDDVVLSEIVGDTALTHGQRLPSELERALETAAVRIEDVDRLAVAAGPGSFTGLRIGIASMQGLAFARGLKIVPVSTLDALAHDAARLAPMETLIASWIDAQRGEVFAALYDRAAERVIRSPTNAFPIETLKLWRSPMEGQPVTFTGDGAVRYRDVIIAALGTRARVLEPVPKLAVLVARLARLHPERAVLPHAVVPIYLRRSDAELARDRQTPRPIPAPDRD